MPRMRPKHNKDEPPLVCVALALQDESRLQNRMIILMRALSAPPRESGVRTGISTELRAAQAGREKRSLEVQGRLGRRRTEERPSRNGNQGSSNFFTTRRKDEYDTEGAMRDWNNIHRYVLHWFTLVDGTKIAAGIVSQPITCSRLVAWDSARPNPAADVERCSESSLELGYVYTPTGALVPIECVDFPLWQHGEKGTPPKDYGFSFVAGGLEYHVQVNVLYEPEFRIGWDWEARIMERMSRVRVNGIEGWGITEWAYGIPPEQQGRPEEYRMKDPDRTRDIPK
ncbi:unnamed protein product [Cyprideis torosa]|uniref:Uncharacterized protein n=1 Tax=Cyprideis torosa TaxID=163714 RepID=A0A7R8W838_9CRUS|nr:unnamed protein product [Cyprideis torosa]CAG0888203.1 unnamed protein product [Cyprideis torosa]